MNNAIILQQAYSGSTYANLLKLTFARHMDYALKWRFDFQCLMSDVLPDHPRHEHNGIPNIPLGSWAKCSMIYHALKAGYPHVIWIDADAMIWNLAADLRGVFEEIGDGIVGACQHPGPPPHLNVGVTFWRNSDKAIAFAEEWLLAMRNPVDNWMEQGQFNRMMNDPKWAGCVVRVGDKWNATRMAGTDVPDAIIKGYHGPGQYTAQQRFNDMIADLSGVM